MADTWYAIVDSAGNLVSTGTVVAKDEILAADGLSKVVLQGKPDPDNYVWDPTSKSFITIQQIDRVQDFIAAHPVFWNALSAAQQTNLQNALVAMLGSRRFRHQNEATSL